MPIQQSFYSASSMGTPVNSAYNHPAVQFTSPQSYNCGSQCDPCCCKVDQPAACCGNLATPYLCTGDGQRLQVTLGGPSNGPQGYVIQEQVIIHKLTRYFFQLSSNFGFFCWAFTLRHASERTREKK